MKDSISDPLKPIMRLLKIDERFPLFFDKPKPSQVDKLVDRIAKLDEKDHSILQNLFGDELNIRIHQMSIMSRIDYKWIFLKQHQMKDFMEQSGSLAILLELQHNLGLGPEEKMLNEEQVWEKITDNQIEERARNIIFAIHGMGTTKLANSGLEKSQQKWFGTYTMEFALEHPEFFTLFEKRYDRLVDLSKMNMLTSWNDWIDTKGISDLEGFGEHTIPIGYILGALKFDISLTDLCEVTSRMEKEQAIMGRARLHEANMACWPLDLPFHLKSQSQQFYKYFKYLKKRLILPQTVM
ncbi:hypothetical protein DFH28DRAFT_889897 [Melampsora americana]|nr:hypothetical protein DFH28DRAFT_889897 [Melampsora americana]